MDSEKYTRAPRRGVTSSAAARYSLALGACAAALAMRLLLGPAILPSPFLAAFGAVLFSAWYGGLGPGLVATVVWALIGAYLILYPTERLTAVDSIIETRIALYTVIASALSWLAAASRRSRTELERGVAERTAALSATNTALQAQIAENTRTEQALRESEERFVSAFKHAPIGIALAQIDGCPLQVNQALCDMLGYSEDELLARPVVEATPPHDLEIGMDHARQLLRGEIRTFQQERQYIHKSERIVHGLLTVSLVREGNGRPPYFICQVQDITERKRSEEAVRQAYDALETRVKERTAALSRANVLLQREVVQRHHVEQALRESERRFRAIFAQAAVGVSLMGLDGRWLLVNDVCVTLSGTAAKNSCNRRSVTSPIPMISRRVCGSCAT